VPATAFIPSNGVCTGPTPPLVGVPRGGRGPSTGTQQAANWGARAHTPRVPATKQKPGALGTAGALRHPYVGTGSNIKARTGPPRSGSARQITPQPQRGAARRTTKCSIQPIRRRARSHYTAAALHWPLQRAPITPCAGLTPWLTVARIVDSQSLIVVLHKQSSAASLLSSRRNTHSYCQRASTVREPLLATPLG